MSDKPIALLPCPFCGGLPVPWVARPEGGALLEEHIDADSGTEASAYVWCHECGAQTSAVDFFDFYEAKRADLSTVVYSMDDVRALERFAAELWNDRSLKNLALYAAGYAEGRHLYPRPECRRES